MKLAIMQPYLFPYLGYFQLIRAVDKFVFYDDVNFIKQGWVNRNRIVICDNIHYFTFPLSNASSFTPINQIKILNHPENKWKIKLKKTLQLAYAKAPYFHQAYGLVEAIIDQHQECISPIAINSIKAVCEYINLNISLIASSAIFNNHHLHSVDRVLDICQQIGCKTYINAIGGMNLYEKNIFSQKQIDLKFLKSKEIRYRQFTNQFHPWLSIIDVLMHNPKEKIGDYLNEYELL